MSASVWRICGIDTDGKDLELSALQLWGSETAVDAGASISCSHTPVSGNLNNLIDTDAATSCRWAAQDVASPAFWIQWTLPSPADAWCVRYAATAQARFMWNYALGYQVSGRWLWTQQGRVRWPGAGVLSGKRVTSPRFDNPESFVAAGLARGQDEFSRAAVAGDGSVMLILQARPASTSERPNLSVDGGRTWTRPASVVSGAAGYGGCAISRDGSKLMVTGCGSNTSKINLSFDGGVTWTQPTGPIAAADGFGPCAMSDDGATLVAVGLGANAAVNVSKDGGVTWTRASTLTFAYTQLYGDCAVSADGSVIAVAGFGAGGRVTISVDGGATWEAVGNISPVSSGPSFGYAGVAVSADGRTILVSGYAYGSNTPQVLVSHDSGQSWEQPNGSVARSVRFGPCSISADGAVMTVGSGSTNNPGSPHISFDGGQNFLPVAGPAADRLSSACVLSRDGSTLLVSGYWSGTWAAVFTLRDSSYTSNPVTTPFVAETLFAKAEAISGTPPVRSIISAPVLDAEFGGQGRIYGTVTIKGTPNTPVVRRVRLLRSRDSLLAREVWSKPDGSYAFNGINEQYEYDVVAFDHELQYFSQIANNKKPEVAA